MISIISDQLDEIYRTALAAVICRNSDAVDKSQPLVMRKAGEGNEIVSCAELDTFSFDPWKEREEELPMVGLQQQTQAHVVAIKASNETKADRVKLDS